MPGGRESHRGIPPQEPRLHSRAQVCRCEGLEQEVVGALFEASGCRVFLMVGGEQDDAHVARVRPLPQCPGNLAAIDLWHGEIEDQQRGLLGNRQGDGLLPVTGHKYLVAVRAKRSLQQLRY